MASRGRITVEKERYVIAYAELWHASLCLLKKGQNQEEGSFHQFMASLVFTAFTLEAYLNHIGPKIFNSKCWEALERLGPVEKLEVIAEKIELKVDYSKRPWGVMKGLFEFRNAIAHGKTTRVTPKSKTLSEKKCDHYMREFVETSWQAFCTPQKAERVRKDVEGIVTALHEVAVAHAKSLSSATETSKARILNEHPFIDDEYPFISGSQESSASLEEE